jgi:hypothetical protein
MSIKDDLLTIGLVVAGSAAVLFYVEYRYSTSGGATGLASAGAQAVANALSGAWTSLMGQASAVDGAATGAVLSVPGMSVFQDSAGDFNPAVAGNEDGLAVHDFLASMLTNTDPTVSSAGGSIGVTGSGAPYGFSTGTTVPAGPVLPDPIVGVM